MKWLLTGKACLEELKNNDITCLLLYTMFKRESSFFGWTQRLYDQTHLFSFAMVVSLLSL